MTRRGKCLTAVTAAMALSFAWGAFGRPSGILSAHAMGASQAAPGSGRIVGSVYLQGRKPDLRAISMEKDPVCASLHGVTVYATDGQVNANGTLPNAFVYVKQSSAALPLNPPRAPVVLTQDGCEYEPHVLGVMVGQPFEVLTLDPTTHNVHVLPKTNPEWNVSQQPGSPSIVRRFVRPEIMIPVHCNVHSWMSAYIGVVGNPFYAVTGSDGSFKLEGLPPGDYTIEAWTASFGVQERRVTVRAGQSATANFTFENR